MPRRRLDKRRPFVEDRAMSSTLPAADVRRDLDFAVGAARAAGHRLLELRGAERWQDEMLGDVGDQAADGYLQGLLEGRYPDDGVLSEETADSPQRLERSRCWIVDPLDGTKEYRALRDDWAVHVGLTVDGRCALGAVALPAQGRVVWGVALEGAEQAGLEGEGRLVRGDTPQGASVRIACSRSHTPTWMPSFAEQFGEHSLVPSGSVGNKVGMVLLGEADVYVHRKGLKEWDTCAPEIVARALGWHVCKLDGSEHAYNQPDPRCHEFVICRPALRERVLEALATAGVTT
jgi:3'(2'), 5'-bisphosphate nucleotidase